MFCIILNDENASMTKGAKNMGYYLKKFSFGSIYPRLGVSCSESVGKLYHLGVN